jgi:putative Holliday junction resolvase
MMKRWMGIDLGRARIGLAISDPLRLIAQGVETLPSLGFQSDIVQIGQRINHYHVERVIIGWPIHLNGAPTQQSQYAEKFAEKLGLHITIPVFLVDERLTSMQAEQILREGNFSRSSRQKKIDQVAAALILESALKGSPLISVPHADH